MTTPNQNELSGVLIDADIELTVATICESCGIETALIVEMVDYAILEPEGNDINEWVFSGESLRRVTTVIRLQSDLGVNMAGAALALDLMAELEVLRRK